MSTIAIIPARGGSKGIPRKNLVEFCGAPLLSWSVRAAVEASGIDRVVVSTDSDEIAECAVSYGAEVVTRPAEISGDKASSESALIDAVHQITARDGATPEKIVFLQASSPLRESVELSEALALFEKEQLDSLFSAAEPDDYLVWLEDKGVFHSLNYDYLSRKRRQDAEGEERLWIETGSFYITRTALLLETENRLGGKIGVYKVPVWKSFEIDSIEGLKLCELLMKHHQLDHNLPSTSF